jgi:hypothetical protein
MTLVAHKVIDALLDFSGGSHCMPIRGIEEFRRPAATAIKSAEKFDFGYLNLERDKENPTSYKLPELSDEELMFWAEGLLPLPAPWCWYEYQLSAGCRTGLLIRQIDQPKPPMDGPTVWEIRLTDYFTENGMVMFSGLHVSVKVSALQQLLGLNLGGNPVLLRVVESRPGELFGGPKTDADVAEVQRVYVKSLRASVHIAIYLTLMLNSRTTEIRREVPPPKLNKARIKRGATPLAEHHVVTIVPLRFRSETDPETGIERRSPRLHWRRSHVRTIYKGTPGERRIVIARMLVGRADLGEVSHEYRVMA